MKTSTLLFICITIIFISCKDKSIDTDETANPEFSYRSGKCGEEVLKKEESSDSVFTYVFDKDLKLEFSVLGNCCPDSGRFTADHSIIKDTIIIEVSDIAPELCRCICRYIVRTELTNLPLNKYIVKVQSAPPSNNLLHLAVIER